MYKDAACYDRAVNVLAGSFQTLSKNPNRYPMNIAPKFLDRGDGAYVYDLDGNQYIDLVAGLGPILLGHNDPSVNSAVKDQIKKGNSFTLGNLLEVEVAELITDCVRSVRKVRFAKNGKDVTESAVKIARHYTQKTHMIYCGYHGGFSDYLCTTRNDGGTLHLLKNYNHQIQFGNYEQLDRLILDIDAGAYVERGLSGIMVEPPPPIYGDASSEKEIAKFLHYIEGVCRTTGALFILDEVVTGWRKHPGGAQYVYDLNPNLTCFSKAMGNGYSIAAIGGERDLMNLFTDGEVFLSTTFGGETIGLAAASVVISAMAYTDAHDHLVEMGISLGDKLSKSIHGNSIPATLMGDHCRMIVKFHDIDGVATSDELKTLWQQGMVSAGVLAGGPIFPMVCYNHDIVDSIVSAAEHTFCIMSEAIKSGSVKDYLHCEVISDVFGDRYKVKKSPMVW